MKNILHSPDFFGDFRFVVLIKYHTCSTSRKIAWRKQISSSGKSHDYFSLRSHKHLKYKSTYYISRRYYILYQTYKVLRHCSSFISTVPRMANFVKFNIRGKHTGAIIKIENSHIYIYNIYEILRTVSAATAATLLLWK